ncbi:MAG TPA: hypothetical protein VMU05_04680 [Dongiaceae bacterium]|nr:hypothetical protein [Dongiaceae bacterium]
MPTIAMIAQQAIQNLGMRLITFHAHLYDAMPRPRLLLKMSFVAPRFAWRQLERDLLVKT